MATLVVVESPAKCRTIQRCLGRDYLVRASLGHLRDLPAARRGRKGAVALGLDPDAAWKATWEVPPDRRSVVAGLRRLAGRTAPVVLATDCDREGEAIAWHLRQLLGGAAGRFTRVTFSEITESAIRTAFRAPRRLDMGLVHAQLTRRFVDRLVGWRVSPALTRGVDQARSAGRVQSVAARLVVEREREIAAFRPAPYWEVAVTLETPGGPAVLPVADAGDAGSADAHRFADEAAAREAAAAIRAAGTARVVSARSEPGVRHAHPPFTTSSLQQAASARLKLTVARTMELAQRLYEAGAITYMRTDAVALSAEAERGLRSQVEAAYGGEYVADPPNRFKVPGGAQEAHEAIRPTSFGPTGGPGLDGDEARLYELIRRRALQSQMAPARIRKDYVEAQAGRWRLSLAGVAVLFPGFEAAWPPDREAAAVPLLEEGAELRVGDVVVAAKRTRAPKRFTQATLVRELDRRGIGRPSTYAQTIAVLLERGYVESRSRGVAPPRPGCDRAGRSDGGVADAPLRRPARLLVHGAARAPARRDRREVARVAGRSRRVPPAAA